MAGPDCVTGTLSNVHPIHRNGRLTRVGLWSAVERQKARRQILQLAKQHGIRLTLHADEDGVGGAMEVGDEGQLGPTGGGLKRKAAPAPGAPPVVRKERPPGPIVPTASLFSRAAKSLGGGVLAKKAVVAVAVAGSEAPAKPTQPRPPAPAPPAAPAPAPPAPAPAPAQAPAPAPAPVRQVPKPEPETPAAPPQGTTQAGQAQAQAGVGTQARGAGAGAGRGKGRGGGAKQAQRGLQALFSQAMQRATGKAGKKASTKPASD
jgi:hypothetical protein